jgi:FkbM family methyltransferase
MNKAIEKIMKISKSCKEADFLRTVFGKYENHAVLDSVPVVLYGAGSAGKEILPVMKLHGVNPVCFCDSNSSRSGEIHSGLPIISVSELQQQHKDSLIVITIGTHSDLVKQQLVARGFEKEKVLAIADQEAMCYYTHLAQWKWPREDLVSHSNELLKVYNMLSDNKSREILVSRIALFVEGADFISFKNFINKFSDVRQAKSKNFKECMTSINYDSESYLQFNNDLIQFENNEVLVDGGAFTGDSTLEFIKATGRHNLTYKKIFCFEPDPKIFTELQKNTKKFRNIFYKPFGLWSHSTTLKFGDSNILRPGSTRIITENYTNDNLSCVTPGITEISTTSIDEEFHNEQVTIIKMDIEGAEIEALRGAINTIKRCRPKLVISAYHKRNDLFEIPLLIHEMVPRYRLFYRHFSTNFGETTLFAIP